ncbi:hypothetical protein CR970_00790 [Candidatus Saccharibacteria bacterium]|nr:MAG: hypothetical protein CR970_00790 [Candidatus Saccharibacteria bacterium]
MRRLTATVIVGVLCAVFALPTADAGAQTVNDFVINEFVGSYGLDNSDRQGSMRVVETIDVTFSANNHGIERAIPKTYRDKSVDVSISSVSSSSGAPSQYKTYTSNGNLVVRIGDPDKTVTGRQSYRIAYEVRNVIRFFDDHDELYWDINGVGWGQRVESVRARLRVDGTTIVDSRCYAGTQGGNNRDCTHTLNGTTLEATADDLRAHETLTIVAGFQKGYFAPHTFMDTLREQALTLISTFVVAFGIAGSGLVYWWRNGKDLKGRGVIVPEYDPPNGLAPAEVGVISQNRLSQEALAATVVDLAVRKYVRLEEVTKKGLVRTSRSFQVVLLQTDWSNLRWHEVTVLDALFPGKPLNQPVEIKEADTLYKSYQTLQDSIPDALTMDGYFPASPVSAGKGMMILGFGSIFLAVIFSGPVGFSFIFGGLVLLLLGKLMPKRTRKGVNAKEHIDGLKMYLETAEADRLKMLQSPDSPYVQRGPEPVKTVELFEKLLPYAVVLGVEKQWADEFKNIYTQPPDWYRGNWAAFNTGVLASHLSESVGAMNNSFTPPSSSGGSGFSSGGGFSGGGGGGGGGGGW